MFTTEDYLYGWALYIAGGLLFMACWWYLTAKVQLAIVRYTLRLIAAVTIFFPWRADPELSYLAPAVVMAGVEGIFDGGDAVWRAGGPLLIALVVALVGGAAVLVVLHTRSGGTGSGVDRAGR